MKDAHDKWGTPIVYDHTNLFTLRRLHRVETFDQFPESTKATYIEVSRCFPGVQVWAVGSRVRGDYVMPNSPDWAILARERAGMKPKTESDFDFLVSPDAVQVGELPPNTERVRCLIPISERIEIPIYGLGLEQTT